MVIISEVCSVADLVLKGDELLSRLPENWYKGNTELQTFRSSLSNLSLRTPQWESQLRQHAENGVSENPVLTAFLAIASELLDAEDENYKKHCQSKFWKWKRRPFPGKLTAILSDILKFVEAGPRLQAESLKTHDVLARKFQVEPSQLPFGYDPKYVPIQRAIDEVQQALENEDGPQVVTLHGEPGTGKSSLAKYVALLYQDAMWGSRSCSFDGVQYLFCGKGCGKNIHQLQRTLFSNFGLRGLLGANVEGQDGSYNLSAYQSALRRVLVDRRMLIILDDVWREDFEVLICLVSRGSPCKYLLTSQTRNAWPEARCVQMPRLTSVQALEILIKHLQSYSAKSQLRASSSGDHLHKYLETFSGASTSSFDPQESLASRRLQQLLSGSATPSNAEYFKYNILHMIRKLDFHPLSLVNVAISMMRREAIDSNQWEFLLQDRFACLEQDHENVPILVYERRYSLSVSASMMLMVDTLQEEERNVLFFTSLLNSGIIPEKLVRFFMRYLFDVQPSQFIFKYISALRFLQNNSLVQVDTSGGGKTEEINSEEINPMRLIVHDLRKEFIRQKRLPDLQTMISNLMTRCGSGNNHDDRFVALVLGAAYFDSALQPMLQSVATTADGGGVPSHLEQHIGLDSEFMSATLVPRRPIQVSMSRAGVPRGPYQQLFNARELVKIRNDLLIITHVFEAMEIAIGLLNLGGEELWKEQAHTNASMVITRLVCKGQMDDASMASLLTKPFTTDAACEMLCLMYTPWLRSKFRHSFHYGKCESFSDVFPATWNALSNLLTCRRVPRAHMTEVIEIMLGSEVESKLLLELQKLLDLVKQSTDLQFQNAVHEGFLALHRSRLTSEVVNTLNLLEYLPVILWKIIKDNEDHMGNRNYGFSTFFYHKYHRNFTLMCTYGELIHCLIKDKGYAETFLRSPVPLEEWMTNQSLFRRLLMLEERESSRESETRLLGILSSIPEFQVKGAGILKLGLWREGDFALWPESYKFRLARFWGNVALLQDTDDTTSLRLVQIATSWGSYLSEYYADGIACSDLVCPFYTKHVNFSHVLHDKAYSKNVFIESVGEMVRTLTIISHLHAHSPLFNSPFLPADWMHSRSTCRECLAWRSHFYIEACWGQAKAYHRMEMYNEALLYLDLAQQACQAVQEADLQFSDMSNQWSVTKIRYGDFPSLRLHTMLVRSLLKDYEGAMDSFRQYEQSVLGTWDFKDTPVQLCLFVNQAVLQRLSGRFLESISDFDKSLQLWEEMISKGWSWEGDPRIHNWIKFCLLEHRGYAKHLMQDMEGSKLDRHLATDWRSRSLTVEPISWEFFSHDFLENQLFDSMFTKYWLLQLPVNYD